MFSPSEGGGEEKAAEEAKRKETEAGGNEVKSGFPFYPSTFSHSLSLLYFSEPSNKFNFSFFFFPFLLVFCGRHKRGCTKVSFSVEGEEVITVYKVFLMR